MVSNSSLLLKRTEAAEALRQSIRNTDKLIASGALPSVRIGRSVLVRKTSIDAFIDARESRVKVTIRKGGAK